MSICSTRDAVGTAGGQDEVRRWRVNSFRNEESQFRNACSRDQVLWWVEIGSLGSASGASLPQRAHAICANAHPRDIGGETNSATSNSGKHAQVPIEREATLVSRSTLKMCVAAKGLCRGQYIKLWAGDSSATRLTAPLLPSGLNDLYRLFEPATSANQMTLRA